MRHTDIPPTATAAATAAVRVGGHTIKGHVLDGIRSASQHTGVSFAYLMAQAGKESDFQPDAGAQSSSAAGLFQFTKSTWLELVKQHGAAHGLGDLSAKIGRGADGHYAVADPAARKAILDLRRDPAVASMMAGEYAKANKVSLEKAVGRPVESSDLYLAHFLGPSGAAKLLQARDADPSQPAEALLPQAAQHNRDIFYDHATGQARDVAAVYSRIKTAIDKPMHQFARLEGPARVAQHAPTSHAPVPRAKPPAPDEAPPALALDEPPEAPRFPAPTPAEQLARARHPAPEPLTVAAAITPTDFDEVRLGPARQWSRAAGAEAVSAPLPGRPVPAISAPMPATGADAAPAQTGVVKRFLTAVMDQLFG